jgi:fatty acid desaturase
MSSGLCSKFSLSEVATHDKEADCWVIVHGAVLDVTKFLHSHPGGAAALTKLGRAGKDVTASFERIGHSENARKLLHELQIGVVDLNPVDEPALESDALLSENNTTDSYDKDEREHAVLWHASRRQAILRDHPDVRGLIGSNPWTSLIGVATVILHTTACILIQRDDIPWYFAVLLGYFFGPVCKMYQFAVCHDICHGTAGDWLERHDLAKRTAMQLFTLPAIGGTMHAYYDFQHLGHHAFLGAQSMDDLGGFNEPNYRSYASMRKVVFFPDSDGDMLAIGTLSLGKLLKNWTKMEKGVIIPRAYLGDEDENSIFKRGHRLTWQKCIIQQIALVQHYLGITFFLLQMLIIMPLFSIPAFIWPEQVYSMLLAAARPWRSDVSGISVDLQDALLQFGVKMAASLGLHVWLWVVIDIWLLFGNFNGNWSRISILKGITYLLLSELCMYGFGMHPYMGYFLGVHRSRGKGFENTKKRDSGVEESNQRNSCQPTMSTYSAFAPFFSMNLTHHVEHHDFPGIPWNRLPEVTRLAPEYYDSLEYSDGFYSTIGKWIKYSEGWSYACH